MSGRDERAGNARRGDRREDRRTGAERQDNPRTDRRDAAGRQRHRGQGPRQYGSLTPSSRARTADPSRRVAFEVLRAVRTDDAYANLVLPHRIRRDHLDRRDAALATELTYGVLREQALLDAVLSRCVDRPLKNVDPPVLDVLRLGAYQLLRTRVPAHAALDATVALTRDVVGAGAAGFVNAVLRRVSERTPQEWLDAVQADAPNELEALAAVTSHPEWIVRALRQALKVHGRDPQELRALLDSDNERPAVSLVALPGVATAEDVEGLEPAGLTEGAYRSEGGDPARLPGVREGRVRVQDPGSQIVAKALASVPLPDGGRDERWLDMAAGPGGKAALLAAEAAQRGAHLVANEVAPHRADLVVDALEAVPQSAWNVEVGDGRRFGDEDPETFDRIMLDAPCTGLGALRRRPEARWRKQPSDVPELSALQTQLLQSGLRSLRPGGVLAYVTCSPHAAETVAVLEDVLHRNPDVELLDTGGAVDAVTAPGTPPASRPADALVGSETGSTVQLFPHVHGTDAMFLALLTRKPTGTTDDGAGASTPDDRQNGAA